MQTCQPLKHGAVKIPPPCGKKRSSSTVRRLGRTVVRRPAARSASIITLFAVCCSVGPGPHCAATAAPDGAVPAVLAEFQIDNDGAPVVIPVVIDGACYRVMLDTGSSVTALHTAHRHVLGKAVVTADAEGAAGQLELDAYRSRTITIGNIRVRPERYICCFDLRFFQDGAGRQIDGILSMDVLQHLVFKIDFDTGKLAFLSGADRDAGEPIPVIWDTYPDVASRVPFVRALIDGRDPDLFLIDTGAVKSIAGSLAPPKHDALVRRSLLTPIATAPDDGIVGAGAARMPLKEGRLSMLSLGKYRHHKLIFARAPGTSMLGLGYLSRFIVTFDFPKGLIYLKPGKNFARSDVDDLSGIRLARKGEFPTVEWVRLGGAGAKAAIAAGDAIVAIDGRSTRELNLFVVRRTLSIEGRHTLRLRRDNVDRETTIMLSEMPLRNHREADPHDGARRESPRAAR